MPKNTIIECSNDTCEDDSECVYCERAEMSDKIEGILTQHLESDCTAAVCIGLMLISAKYSKIPGYVSLQGFTGMAADMWNAVQVEKVTLQ